ncbi:MAG TPA: zinc ribbon domain-containing protein, partial [Myxococcales bacterium]
MDCPRCGAHNETDVGSCLSCGASMSEDESLPTIAQKPMSAAPGKSSSPRLGQGAPPKQCPNCMTLNAATFKFCARCGTPLGATGAPASAPPGARPAAAGKPAPSSKAPPPPPAKPPAAARPAPPPPPKPMAGQVRPPAPPAKPATP